ncbi:MAG: glutamyl-tRNA synthetase [Candidatus Parcubacteria bacterium]|jgi:glutamyl/glutaminyl-tRNA synthetase
MQRLPIHKKYLQKLLEQGLAYEARESSEELEAMRMECESKKIPFVYRQRQYSDEQLQARKDTGRIPVIRIKVPQEEIRFHDAIKGDVSFHGKDIGDFVLMKAD